MRLRITLKQQHPKQLIPINYKYPVAAWIYGLLNASSPGFAQFLHHQGFNTGGKKFKFFTFSDLHLKKYQIKGDRIQLLSPSISVNIALLASQIGDNLLMGIFRQQQVSIGDHKSQAYFYVDLVERLQDTIGNHSTKATLKTASQIAVSTKIAGATTGKDQHHYLAPDQPTYKHHLLQNLANKYQIAVAHQLLPQYDPDQPYPPLDCRIQTNTIKKRSVQLQANKKRSRVVAYYYTLQLQGPPPLLQLAYYTGLGEKNSMGFGYVQAIVN